MTNTNKNLPEEEILLMFWIFFYCLEILQIKAVKRVKEFSCKTRIISGSGACNVLKELNSQRLFVVTDPFFEENGTAAEIAAYSSAPEIKRYSAVAPDPTVEQVARAAQSLQLHTVYFLKGVSQ